MLFLFRFSKNKGNAFFCKKMLKYAKIILGKVERQCIILAIMVWNSPGLDMNPSLPRFACTIS
jgi:hypothetical protein